MASLLKFLRKTLKRGTNVVRRVGKISRNTLKKGTNAVGLTKKAKKGRRSTSRRSRRQ
jgi:hypothetical protein